MISVRKSSTASVNRIVNTNDNSYDRLNNSVKFNWIDNIKLSLCCCRSKETIMKSKLYSFMLKRLKENYFKFISKESQYIINQKVVSCFKEDLIDTPCKLVYYEDSETVVCDNDDKEFESRVT